MARMVTNSATVLALLAGLPVLGACTASGPSTASAGEPLLIFPSPPSRFRAPSAERPAWLPSLPADLPRFRAPDDGFRG